MESAESNSKSIPSWRDTFHMQFMLLLWKRTLPRYLCIQRILLQKVLKRDHISRACCTMYIQIFKGCKFRGFCRELVIYEISSLKFNWQNFCLYWLKNTIHLNGNVWHLQGMMASFNLSRCSRWGSLKIGRQTYHLTPLFNLLWLTILYGPDSGLWCIPWAISMHPTRDKRVCHQT